MHATTADEAQAWLGAASGSPMVGVDTETSGWDPWLHRLRLVQVAAGPDRPVLVLDAEQVDPAVLTPLLVDRSELGGMADEPLVSPGYTSGGVAGIQVKTMRRDEVDGYRVRCRRLTVPIVLEPNAGVRITGTGL